MNFETSRNSAERLIKKEGAERVSLEACDELRLLLEEMASVISKEAIHLSKHANRKTVHRQDIKLAYNIYLKKGGF